jgi:hypothetical protein
MRHLSCHRTTHVTPLHTPLRCDLFSLLHIIRQCLYSPRITSSAPSEAGSIPTEETIVKQRTRLSRPLVLMVVLAVLMLILCSAGGTPATIGDQVELNATHQAGVPLHQEP